MADLAAKRDLVLAACKTGALKTLAAQGKLTHATGRGSVALNKFLDSVAHTRSAATTGSLPPSP
eukprot:9630699-Alexandrium_andersonii.AAC.1